MPYTTTTIKCNTPRSVEQRTYLTNLHFIYISTTTHVASYCNQHLSTHYTESDLLQVNIFY